LTVPVDLEAAPPVSVPTSGVLGRLQAVVDKINAVLIAASALAAGAAGCVLTWEVAGRYFFKIPSYWQDELSVFLLIGATFLAASWIQTRRGHVGISALEHILPPATERARRIFADAVSFAFCAFFCWKSWTLLMEAVDEGQISNTPWGPPLWIPYGIMSIGMTMLVAQLAIQFAVRLMSLGRR
jgi:TRAP-type C4-dicarboxylate transport system permease small subunit